MTSPTYDPILDSEVDAESPLTESLMTRIRDNPDAVAQGDPTVPYNNKIKIPDALRTDELDTSAQMRPDGAGGVRWSGGGFAGSEADGAGTAIVAGDYEFTTLTITGAQTPTGPVTAHCSGNVSITNTITSAYTLKLLVDGNVTISSAIACAGLEIRASGNITISAAINSQSGISGLESLEETEIVGVTRLFCGGALSSTSTIIGDDIKAVVIGNATVSSTWTALWTGSGGIAAGAIDGLGWSRIYGDSLTSAGFGAVAVGERGGGGGGGTGGGAGGSSTAAGGSADPYRSGHRLYALPQDTLRRGSGGGASNGGDGHDGGGRISLYVGGALTATGAVFTTNGGTGSNVGGGGGGFVRVVCKGNIAGGTLHADGGTSTGASGDGGGGGVFFAASGYSGSQTLTAAAGIGGSSGVQAGTTGTDTLTVDQIDILFMSGAFDV